MPFTQAQMNVSFGKKYVAQHKVCPEFLFIFRMLLGILVGDLAAIIWKKLSSYTQGSSMIASVLELSMICDQDIQFLYLLCGVGVGL